MLISTKYEFYCYFGAHQIIYCLKNNIPKKFNVDFTRTLRPSRRDADAIPVTLCVFDFRKSVLPNATNFHDSIMLLENAK